MIHKRNKMLWVNRKCRDYLLKQGYEFIYTIPHTRWNLDMSVPVGRDEKNHPVFAKFDAIGIKEGVVAFFQFRSNQKAVMKPYVLFWKKFKLPAKVLVYYDRNGVKEFTVV